MAPTFACLGNCGAIVWSWKQLAHHYRNNNDCHSALVHAHITSQQQEVHLVPGANPPYTRVRAIPDIPQASSSRVPVIPTSSGHGRGHSVTVEEVDDEAGLISEDD